MMKFPTIPRCEQVPCTDNMKGLKAFLYCRVAYNDGFSLELQANELRHFAEQAGFTIAGEAAEYGSGLTLNRAALKEVTQAVQNGKVDVVLVKSVSRIARNILQLQVTAAHSYLKDVLNGRTGIPTKAWKAARDKLTADRKTLNLRYVKLKDEVKEAEQIRKSVYSILRQEQREQQPHRTQNIDL